MQAPLFLALALLLLIPAGDHVLITKKELRSAKQCLTVGQLTEYIVIDIDEGGVSA